MDELVKGIKQSVQWFAVVNIFLRIISGIIRQYNRHSWEFVIKAQLNGAKRQLWVVGSIAWGFWRHSAALL